MVSIALYICVCEESNLILIICELEYICICLYDMSKNITQIPNTGELPKQISTF